MIYCILVYVTAFLLISIVPWQSQFDHVGTGKLTHRTEEELIVKVWCLLKNEEEGGLLSLPTFPLIIKL